MVKTGAMIFFAYAILGLYFLNSAFSIVPIHFPEIISNLDKWIIAVGGGLILISGFKYLKKGSKKD